MADTEADDSFATISASLVRFREEARQKGYEAGFSAGFEAGARATRDRIIQAAQIDPIGPVQPPVEAPEKPRTQSAAKAPRGSVQATVKMAFDSYPLGFTVDEVMELVALGIAPAVSDGSVKNFLRKMEKDKLAYRQGDRWFNGRVSPREATMPTTNTASETPTQAELTAPRSGGFLVADDGGLRRYDG